MKLVEILARELKEWPSECEGIFQDYDGELRFRGCSPTRSGIYASKLATDCVRQRNDIGYSGKVVTHSEWKAELARLHSELSAKPAKKANKDGWIRHRGGKCPVELGSVIDVRYRDGKVIEKHFATENPSGKASTNAIWQHRGNSHDIMAYRLHKPAGQPASDSEASGSVTKEMIFGSPSQAEGPLQWRDRITEIDRTVEALEEERASLVQRLEAEGFRLIERVVQSAEDMSNPKNWKVGDVFVQVAGGSWNHSDGTLWTMTNDDGTDMRNYRSDTGSDKYVKDFALKFHSRPSK